MLTIVLLSAGSWSSAESDVPTHDPPDLYDHYLALQRLQQDLLARSPEEQFRMQPQVQRAEREACLRLRQERRDRVSMSQYRRQGGPTFEAFVLQFERYCDTRD